MQITEEPERMSALILEKIKIIIKRADSVPDVNVINEIDKDNQQAISLMMQGETKKALGLFLEALEKSGRTLELRAQCLTNMRH